nr:MAG TPA: hypothetical protein [Caudoviricetes sp.]
MLQLIYDEGCSIPRHILITSVSICQRLCLKSIRGLCPS